MDDLISRQAAIDILEEQIHINGYSNTGLIVAINRSIGDIMHLPTAENKGRWVSYNGMWECSVCGNVIYAINKADLKVFNAYCGMCGARMEESDG